MRPSVPSHVVHETIDGESIVIHLGTGAYYSLEGPASVAWEAFAAGADADGAASALAARYDASGGVLAATARRLLDELLAEELLAAAADAGVRLETAPGDRVPFVEPEMRRFTDMQEFLLVDPIHEVDDQGWPVRRATA